MKQILRQTLSLAGALCLTIGGIAAQPGSFDSQEPFKTQYILGVNFVPEWQISHRTLMGGSPEGGFSANFGLSFEARITRHSGIETGLYCRTVTKKASYDYVGKGEFYSYPSGHRRYFSIPLLYKYYSRIVNVGVGVSYDIMFNRSGVEQNYNSENRFGIMVKVSKDITLSKGLFLEPEFHFNPFWEDGGFNYSWMGLALGLKYRF